MGGNNSKEQEKQKQDQQKKQQESDQKKKNEEQLKQQQKQIQEEQNKGKNNNNQNQQKVDTISTPPQPIQPTEQSNKTPSQIVVPQNTRPQFTQPQQKLMEQSVMQTQQPPSYISTIQQKQDMTASMKKSKIDQQGNSQIYNNQFSNRGNEPNLVQSIIRDKSDSTNQQGTLKKIQDSQNKQNNSIINKPQIQQSQINRGQTNQSQIGKQSEIIAQSEKSVLLQSEYRPKTELDNINETNQIVEQIQKSGIYLSESVNQTVKIQKIIYDLIDLFVLAILQIETYEQIFAKEQEIYQEQIQKIKLFIKYNQILAEQLNLQKPEYGKVIKMAQELLNEFALKVDFIVLSEETKNYIQILLDTYQGKRIDLNFEYYGDQSTIQLAYDEELDLGSKIDSIINQTYESGNFKFSYSELMEGKLKYLQFCRQKIRSKSDQYKFQQFQFSLQQCDFELRLVFSKIYTLYQQNQSEGILSSVSLLNPQLQFQLKDLIYTLEQTNITALYDFIQLIQVALDQNYKKFRQEQLDVFMNILEQ